ncbi:cytochrome c oxidase assembly protein [Kribbella sp. CA-294648]|uniref:cytochrome c oxidase assembly protein n=1 Tax=Kribbella sp. CA-294648 TaxID=3239948 RepID=UPI003D89E323
MLGLHGGHGGDSAAGDAWLPFAVVLVLLAGAVGAYLWMTRRTTRGWRSTRTAAWVAGCLVVAVSMSPLLADRADPVAHMAQHLLLGMVAPLGLVLGAPVTLVLASSTPAVRRRVARVLRWRVVHLLGHPVSAAVLSVGGLAVVMLTSAYGALERYPLLHHAVHLHYLASGYLFAWSIAGPDPAPRRPGLPVRVAVLIAAAAAHSVLAKVVYAQAASLPMSEGQSVEVVQRAARLMYYGGDLAEVLLATLLFSSWFASTAYRGSSRVRSVGVGGSGRR